MYLFVYRGRSFKKKWQEEYHAGRSCNITRDATPVGRWTSRSKAAILHTCRLLRRYTHFGLEAPNALLAVARTDFRPAHRCCGLLPPLRSRRRRAARPPTHPLTDGFGGREGRRGALPSPRPPPPPPPPRPPPGTHYARVDPVPTSHLAILQG